MRLPFRPRSLLLAACCALLVPAALLAQRGAKVPERPKLAADADTNDAAAYYAEGMQQLSRNSARAADAFYWASRLSPTWADPYLARRAALHLSNKPQLVRYLTQSRAADTKDARAIDSLAAEAMLRKPFVSPRFDRLLLSEAISFASDGQSWLGNGRTGDAAWDAWVAFGEGRLEDATRLYALALKRKPKDYGLRAPRARAFGLLAQYDSAAGELSLLLAEMRKKDEKKLVHYYDSKAMLEYTLAHAHAQGGRADSARAALGRALEEDLSFHMAHVSLAELALAGGDTTTALSELSIATELRAADVGVRWTYGLALADAGRHEDAAAQFREAIAIEPHFALPYYQLGVALERLGRGSEAAAQYRTFLARGARALTESAEARQRLARLEGAAGGAR